MAVPCNLRNTEVGGTTWGIPDDCNWDQQASIDYIGDMNIAIYYNNAYFDSKMYGSEAIVRNSIIHKERVD